VVYNSFLTFSRSSQQTTIPNNTHGFCEEDLKTLISQDPRVFSSDLQISDACLDTFNGYVSQIDNTVQAMTPAETALFLQYNPMLLTETVVKRKLDPHVQLILIPAQLYPSHWSLMAIDLPSKKVHIVEPLVQFNRNMAQNTRRILRGLHAYVELDELSKSVTIWNTHLQKPGTENCGSAVAYFALRLAEKKPLENVNLTHFRSFIMEKILLYVRGISST
jgi:Ulp1 protease family, C-terminal catalytic domain